MPEVRLRAAHRHGQCVLGPAVSVTVIWLMPKIWAKNVLTRWCVMRHVADVVGCAGSWAVVIVVPPPAV